ncbi:uncharacterized protein LOC129234419 [Uloborus diversus]|uniref:uncharacterized protein LOC129234419 n=1 Tax=Uloborus diversus TaxID=327109 RepID=UPI00240A3E11|nr:uncharacterized protein LOC129234419 [Uloborus diversus]
MTSSRDCEGSFTATRIFVCFSCGFLFFFCGVASQFNDIRPRPILFSDDKTLAEVILDENGDMIHCRLHEMEESSDAEAIIKGSGLDVKYPSFKTMLQLINNCTRLAMPSINATMVATTEAPASHFWSPWANMWNGIMPGTKWCGVGDIAESFEELGSQADVDACCRAHDHCPVKLKSFRAGYGLINLSLYTKSHCDCDKEFYGCLKGSENKFADVVGNFYFNIMRMQCLKEHRPFICVENRTDVDGGQRCVKWSADPNSKKMQVTLTHLKY